MEIESIKAPQGYEDIRICRDPASGLVSIISVHNTNLGPALGGCRFISYASEDEALQDVLRLSQGMTYKSSVAGLNYGGGKSVIIGDPASIKSQELLHAYGRFVNSFEGTYIATEDMNVTVDDIETVREVTSYICGTLSSPYSSGHPGGYTAHGIFHGILASARFKFGRTDDLSGLKVAIQGLGSVGGTLAEKLHAAGVELILADINRDRVTQFAEQYNAKVVGSDEAHLADADIYSPCARGAVLDSHSIPQIKAGVVAGAANNQLAEQKHGQQLWDRDILYAPDFVINSGGVIAVAFEIERSELPQSNRLQSVERVDPTLISIYERSKAENLPTDIIANTIAEERFMQAASS